MKLLSKSEVDKAKAAERQMEIKEGAKIAFQIDNLRRLFAQEEANLTKFRAESFKELRNQLAKLEETKGLLQDEIKVLEAKKKSLQDNQ